MGDIHQFIEKKIAGLLNRHLRRSPLPDNRAQLDVGQLVIDGDVRPMRIGIEQTRRAESIAILGKSGSGKSSLIQHLVEQDLNTSRGFAFFDLHGEASDAVLRYIASREATLGIDLSERVIVIDPADPEYSVGLNPLRGQTAEDRFVQIAEFSQILRQRWHLESFGARTDEVLRNALYVLSESNLTLAELALLLGNNVFRTTCLQNIRNDDVKQYFELRYNTASDAMRAVLAEPILNKTSAFISDPRFRHILGQQHSTFSLVEAMDNGFWIILKLDKARLGEQALTLGSLFLAKLKHALFSRRRRDLFTLYCDEIQNLVAIDAGIETMIGEARKFAVGIVSANQFLSQYPPEMRDAILAVGSHIFFQLSGPDAQQIATMLDGGKPLAELLKNLPRRHAVVKTVSERWREAVVPVLRTSKADIADLCRRSRARWARPRGEIDAEIRARHAAVAERKNEALDDWE